jgi:hypothetical protein
MYNAFIVLIVMSCQNLWVILMGEKRKNMDVNVGGRGD